MGLQAARAKQPGTAQKLEVIYHPREKSYGREVEFFTVSFYLIFYQH